MRRTRSVNDTCISSDNRILLHGQVRVHYQKHNTCYHLLRRSLGTACLGNLFLRLFFRWKNASLRSRFVRDKLSNTFSSISVSLSLKYHYHGYFCKKTWNWCRKLKKNPITIKGVRIVYLCCIRIYIYTLEPVDIRNIISKAKNVYSCK